MNVLNIIKNCLFNEEELEKGSRGIIFIDLDDTCLKDTVSKIYRKLPTDKEEVPLSTSEYAKEHVTPANKKYYDYREFRDPKVVYNVIVNSPRLVKNLRAIDDFIRGGYEVGVLTARGCENSVFRAVRDSFKYKDHDGKLKSIKIKRGNVFAVNDDDKAYPGKTDFEKKKIILRKYASGNKYDYVYFIDDDDKNIKALKELKGTLPREQAYKLRSIKSNPSLEEEINNRELLVEMALKDLNKDGIMADIHAGNYDTAAKKYIKVMKAQSPDVLWPEFLYKLGSYGIRTFRSAEKNKKIPVGAGEKMVEAIRKASATAEPQDAKNRRLVNAVKEKSKTEKEEKRKEGLSKEEKKFEFIEEGIKKLKERKSNFDTILRRIVTFSLATGERRDSIKSKALSETQARMTKDRINSLLGLIPDSVKKEEFSAIEKKGLEKAGTLGETFVLATKAEIYAKRYFKEIDKVIYGFESALEEMKEENPDITKEEMFKKMTAENYAFFDYENFKSLLKYPYKVMTFRRVKESERAERNVKSIDSIKKISSEYHREINELADAYRNNTLANYVKENLGSLTKELNSFFNKKSDNLREDDENNRKTVVLKKKPKKVAVRKKVIKPNVKKVQEILRGKNTGTNSYFSKHSDEQKYDNDDLSELIKSLPKEAVKVARDRINNKTGNTREDIATLRDFANKDDSEITSLENKKVFEIVANILLSKLEPIDMLNRHQGFKKHPTDEEIKTQKEREEKIDKSGALEYRKTGAKKYKKYDDRVRDRDQDLTKDKWLKIRRHVSRVDFKVLKDEGLLPVVSSVIGYRFENTSLTKEQIDELFDVFSKKEGKGNITGTVIKELNKLKK